MFDEREVSASEAKFLAEEWGCPHFETSAKTNSNVDENVRRDCQTNENYTEEIFHLISTENKTMYY